MPGLTKQHPLDLHKSLLMENLDTTPFPFNIIGVLQPWLCYLSLSLQFQNKPSTHVCVSPVNQAIQHNVLIFSASLWRGGYASHVFTASSPHIARSLSMMSMRYWRNTWWELYHNIKPKASFTKHKIISHMLYNLHGSIQAAFIWNTTTYMNNSLQN